MLRHLLRDGGRSARRATVAAALGILPALGACSSVTDSLLEAEDPDIINPGNLRTPSAALAVRNGALERFRTVTGGDESTWLFGGLLADEWGTSSTFVQNDETDKRQIEFNNSSITGMYRDLNRVRTASNQAISLLNEFYADSSAAIAEMYFARGFAEAQLAQDFCGAIPLSDAASDGPIEYVAPSTTAEVFTTAIASYDSALALVGSGTSARARQIANAARIGKARALLGNGEYAAAAAAVAGVPTDYAYQHTFALTSGNNILWGEPASGLRYLVGDSLEGNQRNLQVRNNLPFFSADDPRVPADYLLDDGDTTVAQDGSSYARVSTLYARLTSIDVVNGVDARLVEAEAALQAGNPGAMLAILNALRATDHQLGEVAYEAGELPPLVLPATEAEQVDLLFREKAFWTFTRGQRLGDLRRLIRQYGRTAENVFPEGPHYRGGEYGDDVNLPVPQQEDNNPNYDRSMCVNTQA
jgi:hypothetical protein